MSAPQKRTISLPGEQADFIDSKVATGDYASASEVVRAGLRALQERDQAVERWLREEVMPAYDDLKADPSQAMSLDEVRAALRSRHAERLRAKP